MEVMMGLELLPQYSRSKPTELEIVVISWEVCISQVFYLALSILFGPKTGTNVTHAKN